jgi:hypothetical protein
LAFGVNTLVIVMHLLREPFVMATLIDRDQKHCDFLSFLSVHASMWRGTCAAVTDAGIYVWN